jgi:hypothetical protein
MQYVLLTKGKPLHEREPHPLIRDDDKEYAHKGLFPRNTKIGLVPYEWLDTKTKWLTGC